ncbi:LytR/AlgR family response regulator transcription factor [Lactiplantibacillus pentosus]|uniref:LytR/AlgR family response regulator transcription factor n=1 Tax=Lactiplantibacillus pentosus TaxID=1589 RepID=UPI0020903EE6|nr:LytTR family DNA-binding domain-containing protein [Lactiplantibacillus pentosus]WMB64769.1 LytTR family DNA-binding domain-containing protein [Lactiplantibacillus pentosus]
MIKVYICEDDPKQLQELEQLVSKVIIDRQLDMGFGLSSSDSHEILASVRRQSPEKAVFLLDIALNSDINGIQLASEIRDLGGRNKIIFVTTHTELSLTVFQYQVEALDFILKDFPDQLYDRLRQVLTVAQTRFKSEEQPQEELIQIKIGETIRSLEVQHVLFFESSLNPHKIVVHLDDGELEYYGLLKDVPDLNDNFYRCHKSYVVNLTRIRSLDKRYRQVTMADGERVLCSAQASRYLARRIGKY